MSFSGWNEYKLGDICLLGDGAHTKVERLKSGIPYLTSKNIKNGYTTLEKVDYIGENDFSRLFGISQKSVRHLQQDDLLIGIIGTLGNCYLYKHNDKFGISSSIGILRPNIKLIYPNFLYYVVSSMEFSKRIQTVKGGSVQSYTNLPTLRTLELKVPPLNVQKSIAHILTTLDGKIEVNNQINKTIENMAQTIFKQWFVDFEFPNEDGEPYKSSGGEMVESELGMIPKGWEVKNLGEIIEVHDSKRVPISKNVREKKEKIYPYYGAASLMDYVDKYIFDGLYILLGEDGTVITSTGNPILQYVWGKFWVNNHAHVLTGKKGISINYLYILLNNINVSGAITGAVQLKINQKNLRELKIIMPNDIKLISQFSDIVDKSFEKIRVITDENKSLILIRDTLLPKLMSGEIRVPLDSGGEVSKDR